MLAKSWGAPTITNDGVSIASEIDLEDPQENIGAHCVRLSPRDSDSLVEPAAHTPMNVR